MPWNWHNCSLAGSRCRPPALVLLVLLQLLLLTESSASSIILAPKHGQRLPDDLVTDTQHNIDSVCQCRKMCITDERCRAYTVHRPDLTSITCMFSSDQVEDLQLEDSAFSMTFLKSDSQASIGSAATTASVSNPAPSSTIEPATSIIPSAIVTSAAAAAATINSLAETSSDSTTRAVTTSETPPPTTAAVPITSPTVAETEAPTTQPTTTTTTAGLSGSQFFVAEGKGANPGKHVDLLKACQEENGVVPSITTPELLENLIDGNFAEDEKVYVSLNRNSGSYEWYDGTKHSDTPLASGTGNFEWDLNDKPCYALDNSKIYGDDCDKDDYKVLCAKS